MTRVFKLGRDLDSLTRDAEKFSGLISVLKDKIEKEEALKEKLEEEFRKLVADEIDEVLDKKLQYFKSLHLSTKDAKDSQYRKISQFIGTRNE